MTARLLPSKPKPGSAGFTLFEALVSVALMSLIVASLSAVTGQWVPNWHRGFGNVQRLEFFDLGLRRVVADLASAEFVTANGASKTPLFVGDALSVTLVRRAFGPDTSPHLELVNFAETADGRGFALVRTRAPFAPFAANVPIATQLHLADPVALIRAPFRVSFSYAGPDRLWRELMDRATALAVGRPRPRARRRNGQGLVAFNGDASARRSRRSVRSRGRRFRSRRSMPRGIGRAGQFRSRKPALDRCRGRPGQFRSRSPAPDRCRGTMSDNEPGLVETE